MDIVADNYRVGAIADFVLTVVSYKSTVVLKRTQPTTTTTTTTDGTTTDGTTTTSKVGVVVDRGSTTHDYDTQSIPHDRVPPSDSNVMRKIRHTRERHYATVVQLDKDHKDTLSSSLSSSLSASLSSSSLPATTAASTSSAYHAPHATLDKSLEFWANKNNNNNTTNNNNTNNTTSSGGGGLPSYTTVVKQAKTHSDEPGGLPPPPPYTRVVVSPEKAALRAKIQQQLMESSSSSSSSSSALADYHGAVVDVEDQECAVVYRGGLLMPTIDMSPSSKLNGTYVFIIVCFTCQYCQYCCPTDSLK
jgi:hypothetical protein